MVDGQIHGFSPLKKNGLATKTATKTNSLENRSGNFNLLP
jgi:hypothetical protein